MTDRFAGGPVRRLAMLAAIAAIGLVAVIPVAGFPAAYADPGTTPQPNSSPTPTPPEGVGTSSVGAEGAGVGQGFWTPPAPVSTGSVDSYFPSITVDRALNLQVIWTESRTVNGGFSSFVQWSQKGAGGDWTPQTPINLRDTDPNPFVTKIAAYAERSLYRAIWGTCHDSSLGEPYAGTPIYQADRSYSSATWNIPIQVVQAANCPDMAIDGNGTIHVVYEVPIDQPDGGKIAYFTIPLGGLPSSPVTVSNGFGNSHHPSVFVSRDGTVHVAWSEYLVRDNGSINSEIYYNWKEVGNSWNPNGWQNISNNEGRSDWPVMSADLYSALTIAWQDESYCPQESFDIVSRYRPARGTFTDIANLSNMCNQPGQPARRSTRPSIAIDILGNVHLVWQTALLGNDFDADIYYTFKPFNGAWAAPRNISNNQSSSITPYITVDPLQRPHVVWADNQNGPYLPFYAFDAPKLGLGQTQLAFLLDSGQTSATSQALEIRNDGDGDMYWTATASQPWIQLSTGADDTPGTSKSGIIKMGEANAMLTVGIDPTSIASGSTVTGTITIEGDSGNAVDGTQTVTVSVYHGQLHRSYVPIVFSSTQPGW